MVGAEKRPGEERRSTQQGGQRNPQKEGDREIHSKGGRDTLCTIYMAARNNC